MRTSLQRSGLSVDMTTTRYLTIDMVTSPVGVANVAYSVLVNGVAVPIVASSGNVRWVDCASVSTITTIKVVMTATERRGYVGRLIMGIADISRTNVAPIVGTGRQQVRQFTVGGSARTQGRVQLAHDTAALGDALVYTCAADDANGSQPPLRPYRTAGGTVTADSTTASGARSPLNSGTPETFDVPSSKVANGTHSLMAIVKSATTGWKNIDVSSATLAGATELGARSYRQSVNLTTTGWTIVELGRVTLPPVALQSGSDAAVRIELSSPDAVDLDEALIFHATLGALTWVKCGTGTPAAGGPSSRLWLDTATLDWPLPAIWLGTQADGSDSRHAIGVTEIGSHETHLFEPGVINLYTLTLGATNAAASARFFRRWQHNSAA